MKRRRHEPDNRLDWRDPNMPVLTEAGEERPPVWRQRQSQQAFSDPVPKWRNDPTYNMRKRKH